VRITEYMHPVLNNNNSQFLVLFLPVNAILRNDLAKHFYVIFPFEFRFKLNNYFFNQIVVLICLDLMCIYCQPIVESIFIFKKFC